MKNFCNFEPMSIRKPYFILSRYQTFCCSCNEISINNISCVTGTGYLHFIYSKLSSRNRVFDVYESTWFEGIHSHAGSFLSFLISYCSVKNIFLFLDWSIYKSCCSIIRLNNRCFPASPDNIWTEKWEKWTGNQG